MPYPDFSAARRPATMAEAKALASAVRLRILRLCLDAALTNKEIAARLDANPATILHHVRTLVATGFLVAEEERRGTRGAREVPYRATGKSWTLDVMQKVPGAGRAMIDAFLDEISYIDVDGSGDADPLAPISLARLGMRLAPKDIEEISQRINDILREFALRPADMDNGIPFSVFLMIYRDVTREDPNAQPFGRDRKAS